MKEGGKRFCPYSMASYYGASVCKYENCMAWVEGNKELNGYCQMIWGLLNENNF